MLGGSNSGGRDEWSRDRMIHKIIVTITPMHESYLYAEYDSKSFI